MWKLSCSAVITYVCKEVIFMRMLFFFHRRGHAEVFSLISKRKLYPALMANLIRLMKLGTEVCMFFILRTCVNRLGN